jgi:hypothetical protein
MPGIPVRWRPLALAGFLLLLSLGLPWQRTAAALGVFVPGGYVLVPNAGGTFDVELFPGAYYPGSGGNLVPGTGHLMRVTGLFAVLLLWQAIRRGSARLAGLALGVAAVALPSGIDQGAAEPGRLCYLAAIVAAAVAVGMLPRPRSEVQGLTDPS